MAQFRKPSLEEETLRVHIIAGKADGLWEHDHATFEKMRHTYKMSKAQMQRAFNLKAPSTMANWWRVDDLEHEHGEHTYEKQRPA